jgi:GntR family transcriptional regulator
MLNFTVVVQPGAPIYEQIVFAVKRAIVQGQLRHGDRFPSVREIAQELQINPNTAQKALAELVRQGLLEVYAGSKGAVVCAEKEMLKRSVEQVLGREIEQMVAEAKRHGISRTELVKTIRKIW